MWQYPNGEVTALNRGAIYCSHLVPGAQKALCYDALMCFMMASLSFLTADLFFSPATAGQVLRGCVFTPELSTAVCQQEMSKGLPAPHRLEEDSRLGLLPAG